MSAPWFFYSDDQGAVRVALSEGGNIYLEGFAEPGDAWGGTRLPPDVARKVAAALVAAALVAEAEEADRPPPR